MLLRVGSTGDDVKKVQKKLGVQADGIFGSGTEKAVKTWQAEHGLKADGIVGPATWGSMFSAAPASKPAPAGGAVPVNAAGVKLDTLVGHVPEAVISQIPGCAEKFSTCAGDLKIS